MENSSKSMMTVPEFCRDNAISRSLFYKLRQRNIGPDVIKLGRRTLISAEAAQEWRRRMQKLSRA